MNFTIEFFRSRPSDEAHATLDRISIVADNLDAATVKARSLFDTLYMHKNRTGCDDAELLERAVGCRRMKGRVHFWKASRSADFHSLPGAGDRSILPPPFRPSGDGSPGAPDAGGRGGGPPVLP
jgi:hypothetical protein